MSAVLGEFFHIRTQRFESVAEVYNPRQDDLLWLHDESEKCRLFVMWLLTLHQKKDFMYCRVPSYKELHWAGLHELGCTAHGSVEEILMYHLFLSEMLESQC